jgi:hypothetical protein
VRFCRDAPRQHDEEAPRGRRAAPRAPLPAQRVRVRAHAEIERYLWNARAPFDDVQLTVLSNLCEPSTSSAGPADSESVLASLRAAGDVRARHSSRFGGVFSARAPRRCPR